MDAADRGSYDNPASAFAGLIAATYAPKQQPTLAATLATQPVNVMLLPLGPVTWKELALLWILCYSTARTEW
jgi:hypothetical protein